MVAQRILIVTADDFGQSAAVNAGVIQAHEEGIVTSASLMVRWPGAADVAAYGRAHETMSIGLHVDLGEWAYRNGSWLPLYEVVCLEDFVAVADEVWRQIDTFRHLLGRNPSHIDSHQHVHHREPVRTVVRQVAGRLGVPLRGSDPIIRYCGDFYGQTAEGEPLPDAITVERLTHILTALSPGITELSCHPGTSEDLETMYRAERVAELRVLCDPRVRATIATQGIELRSFGTAGIDSGGGTR